MAGIFSLSRLPRTLADPWPRHPYQRGNRCRFLFLALDMSGMTDVNVKTLWWDAFQIGSVLFVLFVMLGWLLHVDRRQPTRRFVL